MNENLLSLIKRNAEKFADKTALFFMDKKISYRELHVLSSSFAQGLINLGIKKGDRVAVFLHNCPEFVIAYFAAIKAGAVCVPVNNMFKEQELSFIVKDSGARLLITNVGCADMAMAVKKNLDGELEQVILIDGIVPGTVNFHDIIERSIVRQEPAGVQPDDVAALLYTSGTTGNPKGAMLTQRNLLSNVMSCVSAISVTENDNFMCVLPMFHSFAFTVCILLPLSVGASVTIIEHIRPFRRVVRNIIKKKVTVFVGIPSIFHVLAQMHIPAVFTSRVLKLIDPLRLSISGAAALPNEVLKAFEEKFKVPLLEGYGLTETSPVVSLNPLRGVRKPGSVGVPLEGVEVKVVDEQDTVVGPQGVGELLVKGPNVMKGYFKNEEATQEAVKDSWLFTGDIAKIDEDGYIYIVDRKKDMINVRGLNVYPAELEKVLLCHPKIKEAAVVRVADKFKGEVPKACVVVRDNQTMTASEVITYLRSNLAAFKIPRFVEFRTALPKTATGKVLKGQL